MATDQQSRSSSGLRSSWRSSVRPARGLRRAARITRYEQPRRPGRVLGASRPGRWTGSSAGTRCSTTPTRRSTSGSPAGRSTPRTTAWIATSRPATATASRSTGAARRARSATSPTPTCTATSSGFANALKDHGVEKGDVVGIYLPMIPEVVVAMLACARIGAPHNVVFGGFSAESVNERMEFSEAKLLITVDGARRKGKTAPIKQAVDALHARPAAASSSSAHRRRLRRWPTRTSGTTRSWRRPTPSARPSRSTPSTRCSCSTRRARPPSPRASCTRPAAT